MAKTGKRARLLGPRRLEFEDISLDDDGLAPTEIYATTDVSAISFGTERAAYFGEPPLRPGPTYPRLVGYCNVASVAAVGSAVTNVRAGQRILTHQSHQSAFIVGANEVLITVPPELPSDVASMTYLAALGLSALQRVSFRPEDVVAVIGLGPIGLATVGVAASAGARCYAVGKGDMRLAKARILGACKTIVADNVNEALADIVVVAASSWSAWRTALSVVRARGRIAVLGFPGRGEGPPTFNPLEPAHFYDKQLLVASVGAPASHPTLILDEHTLLHRNLEWLFSRIECGELRLGELITQRCVWSDLASMYERKDDSVVGAVLDWAV